MSAEEEATTATAMAAADSAAATGADDTDYRDTVGAGTNADADGDVDTHAAGAAAPDVAAADEPIQPPSDLHAEQAAAPVVQTVEATGAGKGDEPEAPALSGECEAIPPLAGNGETLLTKDEARHLTSEPVEYVGNQTVRMRCPQQRIAMASGAQVDIDGTKLTISSGDESKGRLAAKYLRLVRSASREWVKLDVAACDDGDLTVFELPERLQAAVLGRQWSVLRNVEAHVEGTMLFAVDEGRGEQAREGSAAQPAPPWLVVGRRVEARRRVGDIRSTPAWDVGTVAEVMRSRLARVQFESQGTYTLDFDALRPRYEVGEAVDVLAEGEWRPGKVKAPPIDGAVLVLLEGEGEEENAEVQVELGNLRLHAEPEEEAQHDAVPEAPVEPSLKVAIFGSVRQRCAAQLRLMQEVDKREAGFFEGKMPGDWGNSGDWAVDVVEIEKELLVNCTGKSGRGRTRSACRATSCIIEYLGTTAYVAGPAAARGFAVALLEAMRRSDKWPSCTEHLPPGVRAHMGSVSVPFALVSRDGGRRWRVRVEDQEGVMICFAPQAAEGGVEPKVAEGECRAGAEDGEAGAEVAAGGEEQKEAEADAAAREDGKEEREAEEGGAEAEVTEEEKGTEHEADGKAEDKKEGPAEAEEEEGGADAEAAAAQDEAGAGYEAAAELEMLEVYVFGLDERARRRAELRVLAAAAQEAPGHYSPTRLASTLSDAGMGVQRLSDDACGDALAMDVIQLSESEILSITPARVRAVQAAAGCGIELLGSALVVAGYGAERALGREYLQMLGACAADDAGQGCAAGRRVRATASSLEGRTDVSTLRLEAGEEQLLDEAALLSAEESTGCLLLLRRPPAAEALAAGARVQVVQGELSFRGSIEEAQCADGSLTITVRIGEDGGAPHGSSPAAAPELLAFGRDGGPAGRSEALRRVRRHLASPRAQEQGAAREDGASWEGQGGGRREAADAGGPRRGAAGLWDQWAPRGGGEDGWGLDRRSSGRGGGWDDKAPPKSGKRERGPDPESADRRRSSAEEGGRWEKWAPSQSDGKGWSRDPEPAEKWSSAGGASSWDKRTPAKSSWDKQSPDPDYAARPSSAEEARPWGKWSDGGGGGDGARTTHDRSSGWDKWSGGGSGGGGASSQDDRSSGREKWSGGGGGCSGASGRVDWHGDRGQRSSGSGGGVADTHEKWNGDQDKRSSGGGGGGADTHEKWSGGDRDKWSGSSGGDGIVNGTEDTWSGGQDKWSGGSGGGSEGNRDKRSSDQDKWSSGDGRGGIGASTRDDWTSGRDKWPGGGQGGGAGTQDEWNGDKDKWSSGGGGGNRSSAKDDWNDSRDRRFGGGRDTGGAGGNGGSRGDGNHRGAASGDASWDSWKASRSWRPAQMPGSPE
ncbi:unnamed protein product [Prorocentrum cordatum]|uniref:Agenet domain-containing protein n=1 Tax=Prorocentrum cordatum TaxID=2364126 RepID=A0ABN9T5C4_9DINO|nr:unnamed protein product [Polarella glacialis]